MDRRGRRVAGMGCRRCCEWTEEGERQGEAKRRDGAVDEREVV